MKDMPEKIYAYEVQHDEGCWIKDKEYTSGPVDKYLHAAKTRERLIEEINKLNPHRHR